ncbi:excinuclease ABC subunit UvrC [Parvularcula sp. ZS-1/3]|uniref:UvrABC system protein C n=1 Tax=Parvularcula mediterranea TaxID=2732508 RepID=A0A7Y3RLI5_9PROT|nr:excinuclease ABC subunit UvrC [Parvularcula mediterranea]NNU16288.1 excinuclease ABC subunit UvrC [Parvularcula mediterranea]
MSDQLGRPLRGHELIADQVQRLPTRPGVYRMFGEEEQVLYVGKAKNLKARVSNYATLNGHTNRIARMITETVAMEFVVTDTETEALLLEANLIKQLRPRYNVLMRDDKSFASILVAKDHDFPQILKHRGAQKRPGEYFGPFASAGAVNRGLNTLQKAFLLRSCNDSVFENRDRPCLLYQIKRCAAPCTGVVNQREYAQLVREATTFLRGGNREVTADLSKEMEEAAEALDFERAARLRDRIRAIAHLTESQGINPGSVEEADVFAVHADGGQCCVQAFFFRAGQNLGSRAYYPKADKEELPATILGAFLSQFYDGRMPPRSIMLNQEIPDRELLGEALGIKAGRKVEVSVPQRGEKRDIVRQALVNAREALARRLAETASQKRLMQALCQTFDLTGSPSRVECYDNSHIGGTGMVGAMIVSGEEGFEKNRYRKFNIKGEDVVGGDDFGAMNEVLSRRFSRLVKESAPGQDDWPGLVVIDGGMGQLSAAKQAMEDQGIRVGPDIEGGEIMLISIAKARREDARGGKTADRSAGAVAEQIFAPGRDAFMLPPRSPVLYYIQRLRDEAHRFAIGAQRAKRTKQISQNPLDAIDGVGAARKKALLHHFGSAKGVSRAKAQDLMSVDGISESLAQRIYDHFHPQG